MAARLVPLIFEASPARPDRASRWRYWSMWLLRGSVWERTKLRPNQKTRAAVPGGRNATNRISPITGFGESCQASLYAAVRRGPRRV